MTDGLTARQTLILKSLIDEYLETIEPISSQSLEKKYDLGISSATIRNEMVRLTAMGYLRQPHTSAGRIPSPLAMKFYIDQLMEEKQMSLVDEVKAKEDVWDQREDFDDLMDEVTHELAHKAKALAVSTDDKGEVWSSGYSNVFRGPYNLSVCQDLFSFLEEQRRIHELFFERITGINPIEVLFGEELGWKNFDPFCIIATRFTTRDKHSGAIGIIGPFGLNYPYVIPIVRYFGNLITELSVK